VLGEVRQQTEAQGVATRTYFEQIAASAEGDNTHGVSGMSTRQLIWSAGGLTWFEGELREAAAVFGPLIRRQQERVRNPDTASRGTDATSPLHQPWWRFW